MGHVTSNIPVRSGEHAYYRSGYKHQLVEEYRTILADIGAKEPVGPAKDVETEYISYRRSGLFIIRKGYCWDGASGPTWDTSNVLRAALVHDALYQLIREGHLDNDYGFTLWRKFADEQLRRILREDGTNRFRCWYWFWSLRWFGGFAAKAANIRETRRTPDGEIHTR